VSETYDVVVIIPDNKSYEFLVTPEDRTKTASLWLGSGEKVPATKLPKLKYFAGMKMMNDMMDMKGNMIEMEGMQMRNQEMDMNTIMYPEISGPENPKNTIKADGMQVMKMNDKKPDDKMKMNSGKEMQMKKENQSMAGMDMAAGNSDIVTLNYGHVASPRQNNFTARPAKGIEI